MHIISCDNLFIRINNHRNIPQNLRILLNSPKFNNSEEDISNLNDIFSKSSDSS